jgi:hypothetical protein
MHGVFPPEQRTAAARRICATVNYKQTEIIMSTLAIPLGNIAPSAAASPASPGLFARLIQGRQTRARREIASYLMSQSDARLTDLGFGADDIHALRAGNLSIPAVR